ncbi:putative hydrolases of HD superfamily [Desulfatibacillum alkenivorans DSM 16219]|jgi:putative hydrolase of HD superfamily|uniref:5'-deoxynucleotidase n=1 Tax=Desulfatibacillum alkenivorans DSM 16219 TaxID=1121393 RepID=A0A1M6QMI9_9BACT|nr:HD family hydrolase [Desulfatibacillum alkenivorans]SHK21247.1 putative hydrolases of HD superfamily [Desulfatibacillum alkenivorans DSM 16219]
MDKGRAQKIARFLYEAGQLRRVDRSGWWVAGVDAPESVAEHSFRTAVLAGMLAKIIGANREKVLTMALYHDIPEARINDLHKVAQRYFDCPTANVRAAEDQADSLPSELGKEMADLARELYDESSLEAKIVADADHLECLLTAKEYLQRGFPVQDWIENNLAGLHTEAAREIAQAAMDAAPSDWWKGLKISHKQ